MKRRSHLKPEGIRKILAVRCVVTFWAISLIVLSLLCTLRISETGLIARYYDNPNWSGPPVLIQYETQIDLATHQQLTTQSDFPDSDFSISWNGWIRIDADGNYHITLSSDDGSSMFIDDVLEVDNGGFHGVKTVKKELFLAEGTHKITINYFNGAGISEFDFVLARDQVKRPDEKVSPDIFFPRPLSRDAIFLTRYPHMRWLLYLGTMLSLCITALFWKHPSCAVSVLNYVDMLMKAVKSSIQQPHVRETLKTSRLVHTLLLALFLLSILEGYLWWKMSSFPHGLYGNYYSNTQWQGAPWKSHVLETEISDQSENFKQVRKLSDNRFSVEWTGCIKIDDTGEYTFFTTSDDGSRLFIDDMLVVENGGTHGLRKKQGKIYLTKGLHRLRIRYFQGGGDVRLKISWKPKRVITMDTSEIPLYAGMLFPPDISHRQFQIYRFANVTLPFLTLCWMLLIAIILLMLLRPDFCVSLFWQKICSFHDGFPRGVKYHFLITFLVLTASMYVSTGTLSPYANTTVGRAAPLVSQDCQYLYNADYSFFKAMFLMLDGAHKHEWNFSVVLRRILYNLLSYPFMKLMGHDLGGIVVNFLLIWTAFVTFHVFILHTIGKRGAIISLWLLAVYPGIFYYVGQPFLYACIVPGCLWLYIILWKLEARTTTRDVMILSSLLGILFLGYDFIVFFGPAAIGILLFRKRYLHIPISVCCMLFPSILWGFILKFYGGSFASDNSSVYTVILKSYILPKDYQQWFSLLKDLPRLTIENFFFSTFFFLPLLFLVMLMMSLLGRQTGVYLLEIMILASVALVFFFNNAAPPYEGWWQMRGDWIARLYQPVFVVFLVFIARMYQALLDTPQLGKTKVLLSLLMIATIFGNGLVVWGPILNDPFQLSSQVYWRFYKHSALGNMNVNLEKYGRRPLGFCR